MQKYFLSILLLATTIVNAQSYNYYFGNIHAHTSYSDGNKDAATSGMYTPLDAFLYAKDSQHIDFYGISEHNHYAAGLTTPVNYHKGLADADSANVDGDFIAMYGMEWGVIDNGGHVIIYGYDSLLGWDADDYDVYVGEFDYAGLWTKINQKQGAFAYLAHPASDDYLGLFLNPSNINADNAIVGMAARSGPAFSTNASYSNPASGNFIARYNDALKHGYHIGVGLDHDTHYSVFGRQTKGRLVVLAASLTRANILDAFKNMRFYSSDDWNCKVNFNIANNPIGSIISKVGNPTLTVTVADDDNEGTASIAIYYGVPGSGTNAAVLSTTNNTSTLNYTHNISNNSTYYYYAKITQSDGDVIWTSPIWYNRNDAITNTPPVADISSSTTSTCIGVPVTFADNSSNAPTAWAWSLPGALPDTSNSQNAIATYAAPGTYTTYLVASNAFGSDTSQTITVTITPPPTVTAIAHTICKGQTDTLTASGADTYSWSNGATGAVIYVSPTITSDYTVTGYTNNGCSNTYTVLVTVQNCTGVDEASAYPINIFPNPAYDFARIDATSIKGTKLIEVFDMVGRKVLNQTSAENTFALDVTALYSGSYVVKISTKNNNIVSHQQLIVQH